MYIFEISNDEQDYKYQYFYAKKHDGYVPLFDYSYNLILNAEIIEKHYLLFSIEKYNTTKYNNKLYRVSNDFGDFCFKELHRDFPDRYLIYLQDNYYLYYYFNQQAYFDQRNNEICCRPIYFDDKVISYDADSLDWYTVTAKKVYGLIPIEIDINLIREKLELMKAKIESLKLLQKL